MAAGELVTVVASRFLNGSAAEVAELLGIACGFVGLAILGIMTTLLELVGWAVSTRAGAYDLAVSNLLGSNASKMAVLFLLEVGNGEHSLLADR